MRIHAVRSTRTLAIVLLVFAVSVGAQSPHRIETPEALAQIVKKVDPVAPSEAAAKKIGGVVIADVIIDRAGAVSSITILDGTPILRPAAEAALRQWRFKPFQVGGRPSAVQVILEVEFPDPLKDERDRIYQAHRAADLECQRQLEADPAGAQRACADALEKTNALPADRVLERSHAAGNYAFSLMAVGRLRDAIPQFRKALEIRTPHVGGPDADSADLLQVIGSLHHRLSEWTEAEGAFSRSIAEYSGALERVPSMRELYLPRMKTALLRYASLKRATGDLAGANTLEARAAALVSAPDTPAAGDKPNWPLSSRHVGGIIITEPPNARLTDDDLAQIHAVLRPTGKRVARLQVSGEVRLGGSGRTEPDWGVDAVFEPEIATRALRRGTTAWVVSAPGTVRREWSARGTRDYMQVARPGGDAAEEAPFFIQGPPNLPMPKNDEFVSAVQFARDRAVTAPTDRLLSDVQPWPIEWIIGAADGQMTLHLRDPATGSMQTISLKRQEGRWTLGELSGFRQRR